MGTTQDEGWSYGYASEHIEVSEIPEEMEAKGEGEGTTKFGSPYEGC